MEKELEVVFNLLSHVSQANQELRQNSLISLVGDEFPSPDHVICAMLNHVWDIGKPENRYFIKYMMTGGAKPEGWHWGKGSKGRGMAQAFGTIITYNVGFDNQSFCGIEPPKPEFRHLSKSKLMPMIDVINEEITKANSAIKKAAFDFCKAVDREDAHEIAAALFLYGKSVNSSMHYELIPGSHLIQEVLTKQGVLSVPPYVKGQHAEFRENIYEITRVELKRSGINMEWDIKTCSLKKDGTINEGNQSQRVHSSDTNHMRPTDIADWEYSKDEKRWVKKVNV